MTASASVYYTTGLITGTFDLLHVDHFFLWWRASRLCQNLLIGLECDERVRSRKGPNRPFYPQQRRKERIERLFDSAQVVILPTNFCQENVREQWLRDHHVDVLFIGNNDQFAANKRQLMKKCGGDVIELKSKNVISMTKILNREQSGDYLLQVEDRRWLK